MTCLVCATKFYTQSWSSPREDCDCGANLSMSKFRVTDDVDLRQLRADWRKKQAQQDAGPDVAGMEESHGTPDPTKA